MNKFKKLLWGIFILSIVFASCLKDNKFLDIAGTSPLVEFTRGSIHDTTGVSLSLVPPLVEVDSVVALDIASPQVLGHDVTLTVKLDTMLIAHYDTANGANYEPLPDSLFQVSSYKVIIRAGHRLGRLPIKLLLANYDYVNHKYAIGFTITDAQGLIISGNAHSFVWTLDVRNQFDGIYQVSGATLRAGSPAKTGEFTSYQLSLATVGASAVQFLQLQNWADNTGVGVGYPILSITPSGTTYPVSISSPALGSLTNDPGYTSIYDPAKQTFYISFTWGAGPASRLATDTLVYLKARP